VAIFLRVPAGPVLDRCQSDHRAIGTIAFALATIACIRLCAASASF
jgi:hypothetical protein